jgi:undecaprenyl-diphosphatase
MAKWPAFRNFDVWGWAKREPLLLSLVCLSSATLLGFAILASEAMKGETHAFDQALLLALRRPGEALSHQASNGPKPQISARE